MTFCLANHPSHGNLAKVARNEMKVDIVSMWYMATSDGVAEFFISNIPPYYTYTTHTHIHYTYTVGGDVKIRKWFVISATPHTVAK